MPPRFTACVKAGGKVYTKRIGSKKYMHICVPKGGGSSVGGEVKTKKKAKMRGQRS